MSTANWRRTTQILLLVGAVLTGLYDLAAYNLGGNEATISKVTLDAAKDWPILPVLVGILVGHFFWPQTGTKT